jgi:hypothetical protein
MSSFASASSTDSAIAATPEVDDDRLVVLVTGGGQSSDEFEVRRDEAMLMKIVATMLEDDEDEKPIVPLPNLSNTTLVKILEYIRLYKAEAMRATEKPLRDDDLSRLLQPQYVSYIDYDVMDDAQLDALTDLMLGANYVNCQPLLDLCCMKCASHIKNKTPEQIRQFLRIPEPLEKPEEDKLVEATRPNEQRDV